MRTLVALLALAMVGCSALPFNSHVKEIDLTGPIYPEETADFLHRFIPLAKSASSGDVINIYINSPGGSVQHGFLIIEAMKAAQAKGITVNTVCVQLCASMAAIILEFGDHRLALSTAVIMFHHIYYGDDRMRRDEPLLITQHAVLEEMGERSGIPEEVWLALFSLKGDLWFSARDAVRLGLVERIVTLEL
jgi:ATP-dependent Clp protease protease subunit